ncbi:ATP-binding protein [Flavobacterium sp. WV_118_3]|uniref:ATP-binding protein n=1 Tax=Flavobacterium sp. WV_118_3 TaxID=3151764 RepID=UPI00321A1F68
MNTVTEKITTNTRVIKSLLVKYSDTFKAFKELINNSIQANAKNIKITIAYDDSATVRSGISKITIEDDGHGVPYSEFKKRILQIATDVKEKGQGIGRFGSFQIGELMKIETVAFDPANKQFSKTSFGIDTIDLKDIELEKTDVKVDYQYFDTKKASSYYKVEIENLHHNSPNNTPKKDLLVEAFKEEKFPQAIFEHYPYEVFNEVVYFYVNGKKLNKKDFVIGKPHRQKVDYTNRKGEKYGLNFYFYNVNTSLNKVKIFLQTENAGIKSVAHEFTFSSDWYTTDLGTWFIYIDSNLFDNDLFRNLDLDLLGEEEIKNLKNQIKDTINTFFKTRNKRFEKFITALEKDKYYPYKEKKPTTDSHEIVFKKIAYLIEDKHNLLENDDSIRTFLFPLLDKAIGDGNIEYIFSKILDLSDENLTKFHGLLQKTDLENVIHFASQVSDKMEFLNFLHELIYGTIAKHLKERSQLHKIIENELWLFGENYNGTPHLWSDKKIGNILDTLTTKYLHYEPTLKDENIIEGTEGLNNITDLFFMNEKINDNGEREIMVVELKSPKCAIGKKELAQIDTYAFTIEEYPSLPAEKVKYKLYLISSRLSKFAKSQVKSRRESYPNHPFLFDRKTEKNIEVYVMEWSEIIELNKRKLNYLSNQLEIKDKSVKDKFEQEYATLIDPKINTQLRLIK